MLGMNYLKVGTDEDIQKSLFASLRNLLCWIPSSIVLVMTQLWDEYSYKLLIWLTAVIMPLNSIINPFVFVFSSKISASFSTNSPQKTDLNKEA